MNVGITKHDPFEVLAALIRAAVPALAATGRVVVGPQKDDQVWPRLVVRPGKFVPEFVQVEKLDREADATHPKYGRPKHYHPPTAAHPDGDPRRVIVSMGRYVGFAMLSIGAATLGQRRTLEQAVLNLFASGRGVVSARVPACGNARHKWELAEAEWSDEMIFDQAVMAELELTATHPILVELTDVHIINSLRLQFTTSTVIPFSSIPTAEIEDLLIAADGSLSRAA